MSLEWMKAALGAAVVAGFAACSSNSSDDAGQTRAGDLGGSGGGVPQESREPLSAFDSGAPDSGLYCSFIVETDCDGPEDCPAGELCCGTLSGAGLQYTSMTCRATCADADGGIVLCHKDTDCPGHDPAGVGTDAGPGDICRRSFVLPEFLLICGGASQFAPADVAQPSTAPGEINCGRDLVCGSGEKCCVMTSWDAATQVVVPAPGLCAAQGETCDCANVTQREYTK
jgi:hypothetical protein